MKRMISSVEGTRRRGLGPGIGVTSGWKVGLGRDGRVCLGRLRAGRGPSTRRREVGGGRRAGVAQCGPGTPEIILGQRSRTFNTHGLVAYLILSRVGDVCQSDTAIHDAFDTQ